MMKKAEKIKKDLLQCVFDNFCNTAKCNGVNSDSIRYNYHRKDLQEIILELLCDDSISLIADEHDINYNIIRNGFVPKEQQIDYIKKNGVGGNFCLYPSDKYLMQHCVEADLTQKYPFNQMLKQGVPHNKLFYFEWGVLFKYYSDPRYVFVFSDYHGSILSSEKLNEERRFSINTFGVGKNKKGEYVVAAPLCKLAEMPSACQIEWYSMLEPEQEKCKALKNYLDNNDGNWKFEDTIYRSILKEIANINKLAVTIWNCPFFRKEFVENKPIGFDMLYLPTKRVYFDFVSLMEKIVIHNINVKFFDSVGVERKNKNDTFKGSLNCLKEWLLRVNSDTIGYIHSVLSKLRDLRDSQAHEIYNDEFNLDFFSEQNRLSENVFNALYTLRRLIQTHPNAKDVLIPYTDSERYLII